MKYTRFIGIDYSGADSPQAGLPKIQVYENGVKCSPPPRAKESIHWSRQGVDQWLREVIEGSEPALIGMDHGFSFPATYFKGHDLRTWDDLLNHIESDWGHCRTKRCTSQEGMDYFKEYQNALRLTERFSSSAKSVFHFIGPGVALATLAGLPWLTKLRAECRPRVHFWPFDGWTPVEGKHCIAEVYPALFKRRYSMESSEGSRLPTQDELDAFSITQWFQEAHSQGFLSQYLQPPLMPYQQKITALEGWILGVM